jgi:Family of unknown function (DUF6062)
VPRLPAHDIGDVRLADLVEAGGCPVCAARDDAVARFIDAILWESVNDVGFRRELDAARGFCEAHSRAILPADRAQSGGTLGAAILYRAILAIRLRELEAASASTGRTRRSRVKEASVAADCPICSTGRAAESGTMRRLQQLAAEPAWREAIAAAEVCLTHLIGLFVDAPANDAWKAVERRQLDRLTEMQRRLGEYAYHSGEDRRHLMTDDERRAVDEAARLLGGGGGTPSTKDSRQTP